MSRRGRRALGAGVAGLLLTGVLAACGGSSITVTATFDDVGDLVTEHSVQLADVRVGRVTGIELTDDFKARITMSIDGSVKIPRNSTVVVTKTSLLGEKYIDLRPDGEPDQGPFLQDGDDLGQGIEAPELEFVAEQAIGLLGAVVSDDIAAMIDTGAVGFGGRGEDLRSIIDDLATMSATFAARSDDIVGIIDGLDRAAGTLADNDAQVDALLANLSETTRVLAENRDRTVAALEQMTRLAGVQNEVLNRFRADVDRQIGQADVILAEVAAASAELGNVLVWLDQFVTNLPLGIPGDFTQVYMWGVSAETDERSQGAGS